jgi:hypothetical protein
MVKIIKSFDSAHSAVTWMTQNRIKNTFIETTNTLKSIGVGKFFSGNYHVVLKSENNKPLKNPIKKGSNVKFMYGYPVITDPKHHTAADIDKMFKEGRERVAAAATGQLDGEEEEGRAVVINPYHPYFNPDDPSHEERIETLTRLEASRHVMHEINFKPNFEISPELQKLREKVFSGHEQGKYYLNNDDTFRHTIISRLVGGDRYLGEHDEIPVNESLQKEVDVISKQMDERKKRYGDKPSEEYLGYTHDDSTDESEPQMENQPASDDNLDNVKSIVNEIVFRVLKSLKVG